MGRPSIAEAKDTRADLLQVALEMIQTRGYNAFSYQDLADRVEIRKASIHYHFPSKEDLGVTLIEASMTRFKAWQATHSSKEESVHSRMTAYFAYFSALSASGTKICPCGALASEWGSLPVKLQEAVAKLFSMHRSWIRATLEDGRAAGVVVQHGSADEQAQLVFAAIQGVLQTARIQSQGPQFFAAVSSQLMAALFI